MSRNITADQALTDRLIIDDTEAFEELYHRYWHSLYIYGLRKLHFPEDAKHLVRDVFIDLWEKRRYLPVSFIMSEFLYEKGKKAIIQCLSNKIANSNNLEIVEKEAKPGANVQSLLQTKTPGIKVKANPGKSSELTRQLHRKLVRYVNGQAITSENLQLQAWLSDTKPNTYLSPGIKKQLEKVILAEIQYDTGYLLFFPKKEKPWWQKIAAMI